MPGKTEAHSIVRARERYALDLTETDIKKAIKSILAGESILIQYEADRSREHHFVKIRAEIVRVVFARITETIVTILPKNAICVRERMNKPKKFRRKRCD